MKETTIPAVANLIDRFSSFRSPSDIESGKRRGPFRNRKHMMLYLKEKELLKKPKAGTKAKAVKRKAVKRKVKVVKRIPKKKTVKKAAPKAKKVKK